ncbi:Crp/Fnr family transcriptional regulator [Sphingomonas sp. NY01]
MVELTPGERNTLIQIEERTRTVSRGAVLLREHDRMDELFVVREGMMMAYVLLDDGSRQIVRFLFPGDIFALSALVYRGSPDTVVALSTAVLSVIDRSTIARLSEEHPRLLCLLLVLNQIERVAATDRMAGLGRTSARARVATLLLDLRNRMRRADMDIDAIFPLRLTQEEIGDATGLTAVHVNRMLRQLEEDGMIARESGRVVIRDEAALARETNYVDRYNKLDLGWLPPGR